MTNLVKEDWHVAKRMFWYLRGIVDIVLVSGITSNDSSAVRFVDSDFADYLDKRRSLAAYVFTFFGCVISWKARLQLTVALSTIREEYMVAWQVMKEVIWLRGLVGDLVL